ncbi:MAG: hypothetical protein FJ087_04460 [Deltaproteobacteria bacterium]|nr:hypothetical protein [Deltaproteobacteria bacterium]
MSRDRRDRDLLAAKLPIEHLTSDRPQPQVEAMLARALHDEYARHEMFFVKPDGSFL